MKILFIASVYRHFKAFHIPYMKWFQANGFEVYAAANSEDQTERDYLDSLGVKCIDIHFERSPLSVKNLKALKQLKQLKEKLTFNIIHTHTPVASFLVRLAYANDNKTKVIYTAHGFHFYKGAPLLNWSTFFFAEKIASKWTNHIITINSEDYQNAHLLGYRENQISYVHGVGINSSIKLIEPLTVSRLKKEFSIKDNQVVISCVAELNKNKNQIFLLKNWKKIKARCPNAKLLLIGTGKRYKYYFDYVQKNELDDVVFTGYRNDVLDILQISHIITLLSKREGLGKCLLEGMICKLPCIATNTRGPRDLINESINGYLIDLNDDDNLIKKFISLIKNTELRNEMGKESYNIAKSYFLENVVKEYDEIYNKYIEVDNEKVNRF